MERRFPWHWRDGRTEQLVASLCIVCAALAAPSFVSKIFEGDVSTYNTSKNGVVLVLSTAFWAWCFHRFLWKRNLGHAFWLGPLLGALNAGTTFGLSALVAGEDGGEVVGSVLIGAVFGTFIGGGPLGIGFAAVLSAYIKAVRHSIATGAQAASLHVLRASAWLFAFAGACCAFLQMRPNAGLAWPTNVLLLTGVAVAVVSVFAHLRAMSWTRRVRAGTENGARMRPDDFDFNAEVIVLDERGTEEGAFRTPENERVLGPVPKHLGFGAAQSALAMAVIVVTLAALNASA